MAKGYLLILIGAVLSTTLLIPLPPALMQIWGRLTFLGYLIITFGLRGINGSAKELQSARFFLLTTLLIQIATPWLPQLFGGSLHVRFLLAMTQIFFMIGIFFWLFKSEYMWSPRGDKRLDLLIYSGVSVLYFVVYALFLSPMIGISFPGLDRLTLLRVFQFFNIFYYVVLWFTLAKLYMEARRES